MSEVFTHLLLPGGEWLESIIQAFTIAGLEPEQTDSRKYDFPCLALPLMCHIVRSKDVPKTIELTHSKAHCGITGEDIAQETEHSWDWIIPLYQLVPDAPKSTVYIGATTNLTRKIPHPTIHDIKGILVSSYPHLAHNYLEQHDIKKDVVVIERAGKIEAYSSFIPLNTAVVDISSTGKTAAINGIIKLDEIMKPQVVAMSSPYISMQDVQRYNDLKEYLYQAAARSPQE
jgi:ATP phosphoribosyltransferase